MRKIKQASYISLGIITLALFVSSIYAASKDTAAFFTYNFDKTISIVIALAFAFFFAQVFNDSRKQRDAISKILDRIIDSLNSDVFAKPFKHKETIHMELRRVRNMVDLIAEYARKYEYESDNIKIQDRFSELKDYIGEIKWDEYNEEQTTNGITRLVRLIEISCLAIILKISG